MLSRTDQIPRVGSPVGESISVLARPGRKGRNHTLALYGEGVPLAGELGEMPRPLALFGPQEPDPPREYAPRKERVAADSWYTPPIDRDGLLAMLADYAALEPLPPYKPPKPEPKLRRWPPAKSASPAPVRITHARAELGLHGVKVKPEPKVSRSGREGWRGRAHSLKSADPSVPWKGRLVYGIIKQADADPAVSRLVASPLTIRFRDTRGKVRHFSPHLLIIRHGVPWLISCHWEKTAGTNEDFWSAVGAACQSLSIGFEVLTERHLEQEPRASNVKRLWRAKQTSIPDAACVLNILAAAAGQEHTAASLAEALNVSQDIILRLILQRRLSIDLDADFESALVTPVCALELQNANLIVQRG